MMDGNAEPAGNAWQPLTFGGVARFARAPLRRLLAVELITATIVAAATLWFLHRNWCPAIQRAVQQLPAEGRLEDGQLHWNGPPVLRLANGPFLALALNRAADGDSGQVADVRIEFGQVSVNVSSLFGHTEFFYPRNLSLSLTREDAAPWWGAWQPFLLVGAGATVMVSLFTVWAVLAALYALPIRALAYFIDRAISWTGAWRLASAALMSGALFMAAAITLYGERRLNLIALLVAEALHLIIGWVYCLAAPAWLPRAAGAAEPSSRNPFAPAPPPDPGPQAPEPPPPTTS